MSETQVQDQRVMVGLDAEELRTLLDHWIDTEIGMEMSQYNSLDYGTWQGNLKLYARARQAALGAVMKPMDVALVQRDVCVRLWRKAVEGRASEPQPLDLDTVKCIDADNEATLNRTSEDFYPDPRGYFAWLVPVVFEAVAAQIRHALSPRCDCGPDVRAEDDEIDPFGGLCSPSHRCEYVESSRAVDATLAALAEWHAQQRISE